MTILKTLFDAPAGDWIRFLLFVSGIVLFIGVSEKARSALGWSAEVTRKLVHVGTGVLIVFSPLFFSSSKPLLWMAVLFIAVNFAGVRSGKLKGMHDTTRRSYGTVYYPLTFLVLTAVCWNGYRSILIVSMMILAFSDAAAAVVGELLRRPHEYRLGADKKSIEGSAAMFATSFALIAVFLPPLAGRDGLALTPGAALWIAAVSAVIATALEAVSSGGSDNLTAPLGAAFVLFTMLSGGTAACLRFTAGTALAAVVALLSLRFRFLNASGSVGTFILASFLFGAGGWPWAVPILVFFVSSSLLSKIGGGRKKRLEGLYEKTSTRDAGQVFANGGAAGLLVIAQGLHPGFGWYGLYLGAVAAVNADTWATELGVFSGSKPVLITRLRRVPHGVSGAVSPLGFAGSGLGAGLIALSGRLAFPSFFDGRSTAVFAAVTAAGFLAGAVDSLLGATIQAQYACPVCGKATERQSHCGDKPAVLKSGRAWINNDIVNFLCSAAGAVFAWGLIRPF
jgi:uncharacterized protein (TIGR00297 family)